MKRSEMLRYIQDALWCHLPNVDSENYYEESAYIAECVLGTVEGGNPKGEGMPPPFCAEIFYKVWRDGGTGYQWEKE